MSTRSRLALVSTLAAALIGSSTGCEDATGRVMALVDELRSGVATASTEGEGAASGAGSGESLGPEAAKRIYYQFIDERGSVRFVERLDEVPNAWRERVGFVELDSPPPLSPMDAQATRTSRYARTAPAPDTSGAARAAAGVGPVHVVLYGAEWCKWCHTARRFLDDRRVAYEYRDIDVPAAKAELHQKAGPGGIPVVDVGGRILRGFDPDGYDSLLRSAGV